MPKHIQAPPGFEIAAHAAKKEAVRDLMAPGPGTPWEDRGSSNAVVAYFKTAIMSLTSPVKLFHAIRRPETRGDATSFVVAAGFVFGLSWLGHSLAMIPHLRHRVEKPLEDIGLYLLGSGLQFLIMPLAAVLMLKFVVGLVSKIAATELQGKAPDVLIYNVLAYALGPSVLALIPVIGPPLALVWIFIAMCVAGINRLHVSKSGTIIAMILSWVAGAAISAGIFFVVWLAWSQIAAGEYGEPPEDVPSSFSAHP